MTGSLAGRTALVTGASSGFGAHFSRVLARAGAHVIVAARRESNLAGLAKELAADGCSVEVAGLDVTSSGSIAALEPRLAELDILINNAGVAKEGMALDVTEADWDSVVDTNLKGCFFVAQAAARAMKAHGRGGSIVNIASILGLRQVGNVLPYSASKAGLIQMTKVLALEWARYRIRVNAIAPGYFATDINAFLWETGGGQAMIRRVPGRRLGVLADLDGPLLLLASEASAHMTGAVLAVDGGQPRALGRFRRGGAARCPGPGARVAAGSRFAGATPVLRPAAQCILADHG
jgi:NAD(P)-dependent dehydrogenase (short-subunit alcohol dehydrogenase family)